MSVTQVVRASQIKPGTAYDWVTNDSTGKMSQTAVTASRAVATDANGLPVASATTAVELGYVSGVTSSIQTQLNALAYGLSWKQPALVATTVAGGNIAGYVTGTITVVVDSNTNYFPTDLFGIKVDGVFLAVNDRVLVKNQTDPAENGIYTVSAIGNRDDAGSDTSAVLVRASDMDSWAEVPAASLFIEEGTVNADTAYVCTSNPGGTLGTTAITFVVFGTVNTYTNGNGLNLTGNSFSVKTDVTTANTIGVTAVSNGAGILFDSNSFADAGSETLALASGVAGDGISLTTGVLAVELSSVPGLEFGSGGDAGKLQIKTDVTTANTIGVTHVANGAGILYSSTNFSGTTTLALKTAGVLYANTNIVTREVPSGTINSSNVTFTLANSAAVGSEEVFLNGLLQNAGSGNDYTISGATITFEAGNAPVTGSVLLVTYWKA